MAPRTAFLLVCLAILLVCLLVPLLYANTVRATIPHVSCYLEQANFTTLNAKTRKVEDHENWRVLCKVMDGGVTRFDRKLVLPYPADCAEATHAMCEFLHDGWKKETR